MIVRVLPISLCPGYRLSSLFVLIFMAFLGLTRLVWAQTPPAQASQSLSPYVSVRGTYADWSLRCELAPSVGGTKENCALVQTFVDDKRPDMMLSVLVLRPSDQSKGLLLRVITPLNVNLLGRLGLKIDALDVGRAAYSRCDRIGCLAEVPFDDTLLIQFRTGKMAIFSYFMVGKDGTLIKEGVGFPLSLAGFEEGMQALLQ